MKLKIPCFDSFKSIYHRWISCLFLISMGPFAISQESMTEGFNFLENKAFEEAKFFFTQILSEDPENKTARICLGRALGLGGNPAMAVTHFDKMSVDYPGDLEVLYNLSEAFLWNEMYHKAINVYDEILAGNNKDSKALLGKANGLASLQLYENAVRTIDQALDLDKDNPQAKLSYKAIYLARADEMRKKGDINKAHQLIHAVLKIFPNDEQCLFDQATNFLFEQKYRSAHEIYKYLESTSSHRQRLMSSLSYTSLLTNDKKAFLNYADSAIYYRNPQGEDSYQADLYLNKARALVFNNRADEAFYLLDSLQLHFPGIKAVPVTNAQLFLWSGKKNQALTLFKELAQQDTLSFEIWMGLAESYNANEKKKRALESAQKAIILQPQNPDVKRMIINLDNELDPVLKTRALISSDKGGNSARSYVVSAESRIASSFYSGIQIMRRQTKNDQNPVKLNYDQLSWNNKWFVNGAISWSSVLGLARIENAENLFSNGLNGALGLHLKPGKIHSAELIFNRSFLDYNPALLSEKISTNNWTLTYHAYLPSQFGSFNQFIRTKQSDGNERWLYFGSLYYNIHMYPVIQLALNYNTFSYQNRRPETYFSPKRYHSLEWMGKIDNEIIKGSRWRYLALVASGYQFIESNSPQWTLRTELKINYSLNDRFLAGFEYLYSNAAQSTAAGFTFYQAGISLSARL